jgi:hypothetical protein
MSSLRCKSCGLVNFASAQVCKRCAVPLAEGAVPVDTKTAPPRKQSAVTASKGGAAAAAPAPVLLKPHTINGMGVALRDYRKLSDDTYVVTRCVTLLYVPLIPLSLWVIRPVNRELSFLTTSERFNFELVEDRDLDWNSVLRLYGFFLLWVAISAGPFLLLLLLMRGDGTPEHRPGIFVGVMFMLSIPWSFAFPLWLKGRRDKLYPLTKRGIIARLLGVR